MEDTPAAPALREHRLYQAAHLLSDYGFQANEVEYEPDGNLPLGLDPKAAWAIAHPEHFPVELTTAPREALLRVETRGTTALRGLVDLKKIGVVTSRAAGFLTLRGRRLGTTLWTEQLGFWAPEDAAGAYHVTYEVSPGTFR
jgi:predicted DNA-binding helix-hairpin-helix protein